MLAATIQFKISWEN